MITPKFKLSQEENCITIEIRAPYSNLRDLEVSVDENIFIFISSPFYLRLHLPGNLIDNEFKKSSYNSDTGEFEFCYEKEIPGEHFPDLDFITKFLCPKIEVRDSNEDRPIELLTGDDREWKKDIKINEQYGFAMDSKYDFRNIISEFNEVFEIDPKEYKLEERRKLRLQVEFKDFNREHYYADFIENEDIQEIISLEVPWSKVKKNELTFTDKEMYFLKNLTNKEYYLNEEQIQYCYCGLTDILYAYCYDYRTTYFESSIESGWTIIKLASSLSWLDGFTKSKDVIVNGFRRSLIYPLYRNFDLSQKVLKDLKGLLKLNEKMIIKCLIHIYDIFLTGDCNRYIINNMFINDYIRYAMKWDKDEWRKFVKNLKNIVIDKSDLGLNLKRIEDGSENSLFVQLIYKDTDSDDYSTDSDDYQEA